MSSVLILGATGAIGLDTSLVFLNYGFKVYGLVRNNKEKINLLTKNEIIPVIADGNDVEIWGEIANNVDIIIEAVGDFTNPLTSENIFNKLKELSEKRPEKVIIYTSGAMLYGQSEELQDENSTYKPCCEIISSRIVIEKKYQSIGAIIVQPSFVFGRKGSATSFYYSLALQHTGDVTVFGTPDQRRSFIHSLDLAQLYLLIALKGHTLKGQVFIASSQYHNTEDVLRSIAKAANIEIKTINYVSPPDENPIAKILSVNIAVSSKKATNLLGWNPTQPSLLDNPTRYYQAWKLLNQA